MRRSIRTALALAVVGGTLALSAPAYAGSAAVVQFSASPTPAYGSVAVGQSSERTFTVTNPGGKATGSLTVALNGPAFTIPAGGDLCTAVSLGPKKNCTVTVVYTPTAAGTNTNAVLTVFSKKPLAYDLLNLTGSSPAAANTIPEAIGDLNQVKEDASPNSVTGNVLTNDTDADGDFLVVTNTGTFQLPHGILVMNADGSFTYTLDNSDLSVNGLNDGDMLTDSFTYHISDGHGGTDSAILEIQINGTTD